MCQTYNFNFRLIVDTRFCLNGAPYIAAIRGWTRKSRLLPGNRRRRRYCRCFWAFCFRRNSWTFRTLWFGHYDIMFSITEWASLVSDGLEKCDHLDTIDSLPSCIFLSCSGPLSKTNIWMIWLDCGKLSCVTDKAIRLFLMLAINLTNSFVYVIFCRLNVLMFRWSAKATIIPMTTWRQASISENVTGASLEGKPVYRTRGWTLMESLFLGFDVSTGATGQQWAVFA